MPVDHHCCKLLRAVVHHPTANSSQQLRSLAEKIRDWDIVLRIADEHRILPMLYRRLSDIEPAVPQSVVERLSAEYQRNMFHNLANAAELIEVLQAFDRAMIPVMPFKGIVLGASAYGDLTTRPAGDLDLLIHFGQLEQATAIVKARGYALITETQANGTSFPDCYEYHFERDTDGMIIEVRWRLVLTQPRFRHVLGIDWAWPQRRTATVAGAMVPDMNPEITLLMLCMHGSKHVWSRLIWICDVAQLLISSPKLNWDEAIKEAKRTGLRRSLALGVLLAHRVTGVEVPQNVLQRFELDATADDLASYIVENLFDAPGSAPESRVPYYIKLLGFRDRARLLLSLDYLRPNEHDRAVIPSGKPSSPLYFLIRPFRLFRDRSAR